MMNGMVVSALTGLAMVLISLIVILLTPPPKGRPRDELSDLLARNAELEGRVAALEARLASVVSNGGRTAA